MKIGIKLANVIKFVSAGRNMLTVSKYVFIIYECKSIFVEMIEINIYEMCKFCKNSMQSVIFLRQSTRTNRACGIDNRARGN